MATKKQPLKKVQQIDKDQRTMFIVVAIASILLGIGLVSGYFLTNKILFEFKIMGEQDKTISNIKTNKKVAEELMKKIKVLNTNEALINTQTEGNSEPVQRILDALPADANTEALGASLQSSLLNGIPNVILDRLQIDPSGSNGGIDDATKSTETGKINFSFEVTGKTHDLQEVLEKRLEKSIRVLQIDRIKLEFRSGDKASLSINAHAFYRPSVEVKLKDKVVKP